MIAITKVTQLTTTTQNAVTATNKMSESAVEFLAFWAAIATLVLSAFIAFTGAAAWYFATLESKNKDEKLKRYQQESDVAIAESKSKGEQAIKEAAAANVARVTLELQLAAAKIRIASLELQYWPSQLDAGLIPKLAQIPKLPTYWEYETSSNPSRFAVLLSTAFKISGFGIAELQPVLLSPFQIGIRVAGGNKNIRSLIKNALEESGLGDVRTDETSDGDTLRILVGPRR